MKRTVQIYRLLYGKHMLFGSSNDSIKKGKINRYIIKKIEIENTEIKSI